MHVNKHSTDSSTRNRIYTGSYNTKVVASQSKVDVSKDKPIQFSTSSQQATTSHTTPCASRVRDDAFDFAGIAG